MAPNMETAPVPLSLSAPAVTLLTTPLARRIAVALGAVDMPNPRRINKVPVPRMGGIAIFLGIVDRVRRAVRGQLSALAGPPCSSPRPSSR